MSYGSIEYKFVSDAIPVLRRLFGLLGVVKSNGSSELGAIPEVILIVSCYLFSSLVINNFVNSFSTINSSSDSSIHSKILSVTASHPSRYSSYK